jgi:phytanoyl-CoA hydroxylase
MRYMNFEHGATVAAAPLQIRPYVSSILRDGFCVVPSAVQPNFLSAAKEAFAEFKNEVAHLNVPRHNGRYKRLVNLHCLIPRIREIYAAASICLDILDFLFQEETTLYTSLFYEIGSSQALHRDTPYFWTYPGYRYFGLWVALEDVDSRNGCLQVVPGSHLIAELDRVNIAKKYYKDLSMVPTDDPRLWDDYQSAALISAEEVGLGVVDCTVAAGDAVIWHPQTLHGGKEIIDVDRTRLSLVMHLTPKNQAVYHHNAFFNPGLDFPSQAEKLYGDTAGRKYVKYREISFEHAYSLPVPSDSTAF